MCFLQHFSAVASQETESWFFWVFAGATPPMCFVPICQEASQARRFCHSRIRAQVKGKDLQNEDTNHQVSHHLLRDCLLAKNMKEHSSLHYSWNSQDKLLMILSCLNAKHVSKISTSCVLTQEIDWNFQSVGYKTISLLLKLKPLLY